ncbi:monofunctional biosynthetic peptidoglycan transglycosylase [Hyphomicrobium sp. 99]|uniref:monofunctional biosynthetic peptidoglycan transglycosylase n=1 Tax=Hyphomicrobium sp. 99 TaxID=1163419 RepID=UPI000697AF01|nr:monofunctional biosynthetic peptidoglycan transglycosylase [Hyphomicrobium sp. 99]
MDRPDGISGTTAAPLSPLGDSLDMLLPPRPIAAAEVGAALARSLATDHALSAPNVVETGKYHVALETALADHQQDQWQPPLPLPPRAFLKPPELTEPTFGTARPFEPLFPDRSATEPEPQQLEPAITLPIEELAPIGDVFAEIDAEVSSRSHPAAEPENTDPFAQPGVLSEPAPEFALPGGTEPTKEFLGQTVPQRMLEPRLWAPPPPPAFDGLTVDPSMRPDLVPVPTKQPVAKNKGSLLKRTAKLLAWIAVGWLALVLLLILVYRYVNPPASALMLQQWITGQSVSQKWVSIEDMSPNIVRAVLLSEDGRFCQHSGIDFEALEDAYEKASSGSLRGASTISMQVIKNLFLWPSKSYLRKAIELPLTYVMELVWPKHRIMEVYLNIAEWGPGIFGAETASEFYFRKPARSLSERDSARLAVALPNPLARNPGKPGPGLQRLANAIQVRMRLAPSSQLACVLPKRRI